MSQPPYKDYQAKRAERERKQQELLRNEEVLLKRRWYWLGQRDPTARFTLYIGLFTLALVIVGVLQWLTIQSQLDEMKSGGTDTHTAAEAAKSSADTAASGMRPWVKIINVETRGNGSIVPALSFQSEPTWPVGTSQATFQLQISLKNIGHSPARLTVDFELLLPLWKNGYSDVIYREKRRFCKASAKNGLKVDTSLQIILFPEESYDWYGGAPAIVDSKVINTFSGQIGQYILPVVAICTNYKFEDSPTTYQSSALYEVFRKDDRTRFFEVGKGIPASDIVMLRNEASDDAY